MIHYQLTSKPLSVLIVLFMLMIVPKRSFAWGPEGHAIVGNLAMHFVKEDVRQNVLKILGKMSVDTAANWMDIVKSNQDYDFMRSWHYIDFPKEQVYQPNNDDNIINRLLITYNELKHKNTLCFDQVRTDVLILFHLMGDLHMPLHTGYDTDLGGNRVIIQYDTMKTHNLHRFWDEDIIRLTNITYDDCLQLFNKYPGGDVDTIKTIDFVRWMKESRSLLGGVYDFPDFTLSKLYLEKNKLVVQRQLLVAGLRLASMLDKLFYTPAPEVNLKELTARYKNGIDVIEVMSHIGNNVTVCSKVYGIKSTAKITQLDLGSKYPNSPLSIVIFARSYNNFKSLPDEMYRDKNICVMGKVEEHRGKAQIVVEKPEDIIVQ